MKQYLKNLEELLIEENCHTVADSQAFKKLHELVERDEIKKPLRHDAFAFCPKCQNFVGEADCAPKYCSNCGQHIKKK